MIIKAQVVCKNNRVPKDKPIVVVCTYPIPNEGDQGSPYVAVSVAANHIVNSLYKEISPIQQVYGAGELKVCFQADNGSVVLTTYRGISAETIRRAIGPMLQLKLDMAAMAVSQTLRNQI